MTGVFWVEEWKICPLFHRVIQADSGGEGGEQAAELPNPEMMMAWTMWSQWLSVRCDSIVGLFWRWRQQGLLVAWWMIEKSGKTQELPLTDLEKTVEEAGFVVKWPNWTPGLSYCGPSSLHIETNAVFLRHKSELPLSFLLIQVKQTSVWVDGWMDGTRQHLEPLAM